MGTSATELVKEPLLDYRLRHKFKDYLANRSYGERLWLQGLYHCGDGVIQRDAVDVVADISRYGRRVHYFNVRYCHSAWACPVCTPYVLKQYSFKVSAVIKAQLRLGRWAFMLTFTVPHSRRQSFAEVYNSLRETYRKADDRHLKLKRKALTGERLELIKSAEVTFATFNGWHPHFHVLVFCDADKWANVPELVAIWQAKWCNAFHRVSGLTDEQLAELGTDMDYFHNKSVYLSLDDNGHTRQMLTGDYICGWGADDEMAKLDNHAGKSAQVFDLLASDDPLDVERFHEYACVVKGKMRISFSKGLLANIDLEDFIEQCRKESDTSPSEVITVCSFIASDWYEIVRLERERRRPYRIDILEAAYSLDFDTVFRRCLELDIPTPVPPFRHHLKHGGKPEVFEAFEMTYFASDV